MARTPSQLASRILLAGERLRQVLDQCDTHCELNGPRVEVLEAIALSSPQGCSQTELAEALDAAESSVSTLVERMRKDGLLLRMRSRTDRRRSVLLVTEVGQHRLISALNSRDQHLSQSIGRFSAADQRQLSDLLDRLLSVLAELPPLKTQPDASTSRPGLGKAA